jgi:hypothetical protein
MKALLKKQQAQLSLIIYRGPDEDEDGGGTEANPIQPDYADPDSEA